MKYKIITIWYGIHLKNFNNIELKWFITEAHAMKYSSNIGSIETFINSDVYNKALINSLMIEGKIKTK